MNKSISGQELKSKLLVGINKLNDVVSSTLGPSGRNVIIQNEDGTIHITKDGVTAAKSFKKLEDPVENIGVQLIKRVSEKSVDAVGDGTTTSTLLAAEIINKGLMLLNQGSNPVEVSRGISNTAKEAVKKLKDMSEDIYNQDQMRQVAYVSANSDSEIAELITTALDKVGEDGVVTIEESKSGETTLEIVEGMMLERGLKSPYFVTKNDDMSTFLEKPYIILCDDKILSTGQLVNMLQAAAQKNKPILIVAEDIDGEALALLVVNKMRGTVKVAAIKAPDFGDRRTAILEDLAALTGGTVLSSKKGHRLEKISVNEYLHYFGEARLVTANMKDTTIVDGKGDPAKIEERLLEIRSMFEKPGISAFDKENYQSRLGKMTGGVAIINVGGMSEVEMREKKDRVEDALHATKAALEEGIVPGGGMALLHIVDQLKDLQLENTDQMLGKEIVLKSFIAPFRTILKNAGVDNYYEILSNIKSTAGNNIWMGYDAKNFIFTDLKESGILDPTKVTRNAIENASSVASTVLTTESMVYEIDNNKGNTSEDFSNFM